MLIIQGKGQIQFHMTNAVIVDGIVHTCNEGIAHCGQSNFRTARIGRDIKTIFTTVN